MTKALCILVLACMSCTTIRPKVSADLVVACEALCKKKQKLDSVTTNIELNYYGRMKLISNTCTCKNGELIEIMPEGEAIF